MQTQNGTKATEAMLATMAGLAGLAIEPEAPAIKASKPRKVKVKAKVEAKQEADPFTPTHGTGPTRYESKQETIARRTDDMLRVSGMIPSVLKGLPEAKERSIMHAASVDRTKGVSETEAGLAADDWLIRHKRASAILAVLSGVKPQDLRSVIKADMATAGNLDPTEGEIRAHIEEKASKAWSKASEARKAEATVKANRAELNLAGKVKRSDATETVTTYALASLAQADAAGKAKPANRGWRAKLRDKQ